jgi:hypothetical protein
MRFTFGFFLRLFFCFLGAKFLLRAIEVPGRDYLLALTLLFLINVYLFQYLVFRDRKPALKTPAATAPAPKREEPPPPGDS